MINQLYEKLKDNLGLSLILLIGLGVEFSNFQSLFYSFMLKYRPDWGAVNHLPAMFLSAFVLLCIVIFGIRKQVLLSWFLALLACVVSFAVYSRMDLAWQWSTMNEVHFVVIILSTMLPLLVAYTTHQIVQDQDEPLVNNKLKKLQQQLLLQQQNERLRKEALFHDTNVDWDALMKHLSKNAEAQFYEKKTHIQPEKPIAKKKSANSRKKANVDEFFVKEQEKYSKKDAKNLKICAYCYTEFKGNRKTRFCSEDCKMNALH
jgi:predicted membrane protein